MKIGIAGCTGRMGMALVKALAETEGVSFAAGSVRAGKEPTPEFWLAAGLAEGEPLIVDSPQALFAASDAVVEFTSPESCMALAEEAARTGKPLISGTTGLDAGQQKQLQALAAKAPIVWASNMSVGVTLLASLVEEVARKLEAVYDIEIVEMHHRDKVDAPSGTALSLGKAAAKGRGVAFEKEAVLSREGQVGPRKRGEIGFATLRGGEVIGDHTVIFAGPGERIELTHKSSSRMIYAYGALRAAKWAAKQRPALYAMDDVLR